VVATRIFAINPLITGRVIGCTSSADRQHPALKSDINPIESHTRHLGEHDDIVASFIDFGRRQKSLPRGRSLTVFDGLRRLLIDGSRFLGHHYAPSPLLNRGSTLSASARDGSWAVREKLP
jgi:hypothetical protein